MERAHIAFLNLPHSPHVNPTLPVVSTLVRRGHRVTYVTSERFRSKVEAVGAEVRLCPALRIPLTEAPSFLDLTGQAITAIGGFYEDNRPDLILYDFLFFAGPILASRLNVPAIQTSPAFAFDANHISDQLSSTEYREGLLEYAETMSKQLQEHYGISQHNFLFHREKLNIYFYPRVFQLDGDAFDEAYFYAGRCAGEQPYQGKPWIKNMDSRPVILVSTSTAYVQGPDYFRKCIDALTGLSWHVVLAIGENNRASSLEPLPPGFEILQGVPQAQVLAYAQMFICLGGMISTVESAYYGVPLVMITHGYPEPELYAENIVRLGLGVHLKGSEATVESIRSSVLRTASDARILDKVERIRYVVRREAGGEETANRIEQYLHDLGIATKKYKNKV